MPRDIITLACNECKRRNYTSEEEQEEHAGPGGAHQVLPMVPEAYCTS